MARDGSVVARRQCELASIVMCEPAMTNNAPSQFFAIDSSSLTHVTGAGVGAELGGDAGAFIGANLYADYGRTAGRIGGTIQGAVDGWNSGIGFRESVSSAFQGARRGGAAWSTFGALAGATKGGEDGRAVGAKLGNFLTGGR